MQPQGRGEINNISPVHCAVLAHQRKTTCSSVFNIRLLRLFGRCSGCLVLSQALSMWVLIATLSPTPDFIRQDLTISYASMGTLMQSGIDALVPDSSVVAFEPKGIPRYHIRNRLRIDPRCSTMGEKSLAWFRLGTSSNLACRMMHIALRPH